MFDMRRFTIDGRARPKKAIGIDLGTTNCCVAAFKEDKGIVEVLTSEEGGRTIPSYVYFKGNERLIGLPAKKKMAGNLKNTVYEVKRLIGRKINDPEIEEDKNHWGYKLISEGKEERPLISVEYKNQNYNFCPEQISAFILGKIAKDASKKLNERITDVVITVPAYFNNSQRKATSDAGKVALLNTIGIINEPTAAALAFLYNTPNIVGEKKILVYDLGGGTFDLSLLSVNGGEIKVLATNGNTHLGGGDFDKLIFDYALQNFKNYENEIMSKTRIKYNLMEQCEEAKKILSSSDTAPISINLGGYNDDDEDTEFDLTRNELDKICENHFNSTMKCVENVLRDGKVDKNEIYKVILVGGSTRITYIQNMLANYFGPDKIDKSVNPDEAVAIGASIYAAYLSGVKNEKINRFKFTDICPLSLGVEVLDGSLSVIIPRNTPIPVTRTRDYVTVEDYQTSVLIKVYEGENYEDASSNHLLGKYNFDGLSSEKKGVVKIDVTFELSEDGCLYTSAVERGTNKKVEQKFTQNGLLTKEKLHECIQQSERFKEEDEKRNQAVQAKSDLEIYLNKLKDKIKKSGETAPPDELGRFIDQADKFLKNKELYEAKDYNIKKSRLNSLAEKYNYKI